jgi:plastocyanin
MMKRMKFHVVFALVAMPILAAAPFATLGGTVQISVVGVDGKPAPDTVVLLQPTAAWTPQPLPEPVVIGQKETRYVPYVTVVPIGATVRFTNRDNFDHHVRSQPGGPLGSVPPARQFEFRLARVKGGVESSADLKMDVAGTVLLGCHIHNSMRGHLVVSNTPWFAVTDDNGRATINGAPEGQAELQLWHPDQLVEQAPLKVQVAAAVVTAQPRMNFSPRKRPPPPRKGEYEF